MLGKCAARLMQEVRSGSADGTDRVLIKEIDSLPGEVAHPHQFSRIGEALVGTFLKDRHLRLLPQRLQLGQPITHLKRVPFGAGVLEVNSKPNARKLALPDITDRLCIGIGESINVNLCHLSPFYPQRIPQSITAF